MLARRGRLVAMRFVRTLRLTILGAIAGFETPYTDDAEAPRLVLDGFSVLGIAGEARVADAALES
jgi:hypothetical protein